MDDGTMSSLSLGGINESSGTASAPALSYGTSNGRTTEGLNDAQETSIAKPADRLDLWFRSNVRSPLITEPLRNCSGSEKLIAMKAAIDAGEDVNQVDSLPHLALNEGRPLEICLNRCHMDRCDIRQYIPVVKLLLEHGADPRLFVRNRAYTYPPIRLAEWNAEHASSPERKIYWKYLVKLFEEAITKLEDNGQGIEEVKRINAETRQILEKLDSGYKTNST